MVMRLGTSCTRLVQAVGVVLTGLVYMGAPAASNNDYGADYTDDSSVMTHTGTTSSSSAAAPGPSARASSASTAPLSLGDQAMGVQSDAPAQAAVPTSGDSRQSVISAYGAPLSVRGPVGQPPITRWDYPAFRVYFEYDHVIHSVIPGRPEPVDHADQLD